jgi:hypothetical protein
MKNDHFRHWFNKKWFEHKDEILMYGAESFSTSGAYFAKYKWWLKTVYQKEQQEQIRQEAARKKYG